MAIPTDADVDSAVPVSGVPHRGRTNSLLKEMIGVMSEMAGPLIVAATPSEGDTITLPESEREIILNIDTPNSLSAVNVVLPTGHLGARLFIASTMAIDMMTVTGPSTVNNNMVTLNPGDNVVFFQNDVNIWSRLIG